MCTKMITVGVLAHVDSGKTTLSEAMLYCAGVINRVGRVDHRDTFLDTFSLERERGITIFSKQAVMNYGGTRFFLLDTPGHVDFSAETERTLQVLDYAVLVVSGTDGVQSHTQTIWKLLKKYGVPCFIFVNKMDLNGASRDGVFGQLKNKLSDRVVDFGAEESERLENIALCGEELLNEYYENETITKEHIAAAINNRRVFPCMFGSALKLEGVEEFLKCLSGFTFQPEYPGEFCAKVYKISEDAQDGRLTFMKITGGSLKVREKLSGKAKPDGEKVNQIRIYSGERFTAVNEAEAGTVCAVTGISFLKPGDGVGAESNTGMPMLEPVLNYRVILPKDVDAHTALAKLRILEDEDPTLNVMWNERLGEIQLRLMGDIQLEVLREVILQRFGFEAGFGEGSIIYKETIENEVEGVGHFEPLRHYAEVHLILRPAERNSGVTIKSVCREDALDKNWQRLILTHLYEKTHLGVLSGSPVTDIEIILASGKAHPKHTEGGDFRQATYRAVRQGLRSAKSVLLEPYYEFNLEVPSESTGRALSDIQRMYGSFSPPEQQDEMCVITGEAPVETMRGYHREVLRYTRGRGRLTCRLSGYRPCHNTDEVLSQIGYDCDADVENTADSVFCSHGAGHTVKWSEVKNHMHLPAVLSPAPKTQAQSRKRLIESSRSGDDFFASDKELMRIFEQTYGPVRRKKPAVPRRVVTAPQSGRHIR